MLVIWVWAWQIADMTAPKPRSKIRLAVRGLLLLDDKLLLVNAFRDGQSDLMCAPGGGVNPHQSLPDNLIREFHEETGLDISVGAPCLVNEFHAQDHGFHQVDIYFRVTYRAGDLSNDWIDPEGVVTHRQLVSRGDMAHLRYKPDSLAQIAWGNESVFYDPLEPLIN
jgi:8-oxo-dGTP pyrophosphatase MutT (NUDIX family)